MIPWRIKNYLARQFPLAFHYAINLGRDGNDPEIWDALLAEEWDSPTRNWPTKNSLMAQALDPKSAILDVGCGTGSLLRFLKARGFDDLWGLEQSEYVVDRMRRDGIQMVYGRLPEIAITEKSFDAVIASQVLEHVVRRRKFLAEISRVLKPGGVAHIFVPDDCLSPLDEPSHVAVFNARSLHRELARQFSAVSVTSFKDENFEMPVLHAQAVKAGS